MIIRCKRKDNFTVIPNELINDKSLDWKDLGLLVFLLSKPDQWEISVEHLQKQRKLKRDALYKCLSNLIVAGYAKKQKLKTGKFNWEIYDKKQNTENKEQAPDSYILKTRNREQLATSVKPVTGGIKPNTDNQEQALDSHILKTRITEKPDPDFPTLVSTERESKRTKEKVPKRKTANSKTFTKPTLHEISEYCLERQNEIDPEHFLNYYESNGWKVGKNPMKNWQAAIRTWETKNKGYKNETYQHSSTTNAGQSKQFNAAEAINETIFNFDNSVVSRNDSHLRPNMDKTIPNGNDIELSEKSMGEWA